MGENALSLTYGFETAPLFELAWLTPVNTTKEDNNITIDKNTAIKNFLLANISLMN
jgi:hypothetical protein